MSHQAATPDFRHAARACGPARCAATVGTGQARVEACRQAGSERLTLRGSVPRVSAAAQV